MWNKAYFLALITFGISLGIGILLALLNVIVDISNPGLGIIIQAGIAYTIGQVYVSKCRKSMSHSLKLWTSVYYFIIWAFWASFWWIVLYKFGLFGTIESSELISFYLLSITIIIGLSFLVSLPMYWMLGLGCKAYLKKLKK